MDLKKLFRVLVLGGSALGTVNCGPKPADTPGTNQQNQNSADGGTDGGVGGGGNPGGGGPSFW